MEKFTSKTILLYNHVTGSGHHDSWTVLFAGLLLERGYRVVCMTPDVAGLKNVLSTRGVADDANIHFLTLPEIISPPLTILQRMRNQLGLVIRIGRRTLRGFFYGTEFMAERKMGHRVLSDKIPIDVKQDAESALEDWSSQEPSSAVNWERRLWRFFLSIARDTLRALRSLIHRVRRSGIHTGDRYPANLAAAANLALVQAPWNPDFMLAMYVDTWLTRPSYWRKGINIPVPWGGIRFASFRKDAAGREGYFRDSNFRGLCFLDEEAESCYQERVPGKIFEFLPDVCDATLPTSRSSLVSQLLCNAKGRMIILMCGSIEGRKNVKLFCELAQLADPSNYFFAIVGQVHPTTLSLDEKRLLSSFVGAGEGHTFLHDAYFDDEREMNAVIESADILFAVYRNFALSSNLLGKAASFKKPIFVSDRYLMGRRVVHYGIGVAIPEDSVQSALEALTNVVHTPVPNENYSRYSREFSVNALSEHLDRFLQRCLQE